MKLNRRQFVATSAAGLLIPNAYVIGADQPTDRELTGKTICGYQGWFNAKGDGMDLGFKHYEAPKKVFKPGHCTIDLWPDVSELDAKGRHDTAFRHKDGQVAQVFSSANRKTVARHHQWMRDYGIDGAALQRFGNSLKRDNLKRMRDQVLRNTRDAAKKFGRLWMNMYDISGMKRGEPQEVIPSDWRQIVKAGVVNDRNYLRHEGKPVVAIWGIGFAGDRDYTLDDCAALIDRVSMGGRYSVMLGVPYYWREQNRDAIKDPVLHDVLRKADILSPWAVGRLRTPKEAHKRISHLQSDIAWCSDAKLHYLPVIFPGFSWHNLKKTQGEDASIGHIPRLDGAFLWAQAEAARKAGVKSLYVAMFDEIDEGTAIFKCTNNPPVGESTFLTYKGLPSDHYLWLTGQIANRLRQGADAAIMQMPKRKKQ